MTSRQRRTAQATLATMEAIDAHTTQIALATPILDPADLSALCRSNRIAAGALLAHLDERQIAVLAIACASYANEARGLTGEDQVYTEDIRITFDRLIAGYRASLLPPVVSVFDREIGLEAGGVVLAPEVIREAYAMAVVCDELKDQRWQRALKSGLAHLLNEWRLGINTHGAYVWTPDDDHGGFYAPTPKECQCKAFENDAPCKHRGASLILSFCIDAIEQRARRQRRAA